MENSKSCKILDDRFIEKTLVKTFQNKIPQKKIAIITYGATGSGKSTIINYIFKNHGHIFSSMQKEDYDLKRFVEINIDNIVTQMGDYNDKMSEILNQSDQQSISQMATSVYFDCRNQVEPLSSYVLDKCISENYNIIYETTGNSVQWMLGDVSKMRSNGYHVILLFPFVLWDTLQMRLKSRNQNSQRKVNMKYAEINYNNAMNNFFKVVNHVQESYIVDMTKDQNELSNVLNPKENVIVHIDNQMAYNISNKNYNCLNINSFMNHYDVQYKQQIEPSLYNESKKTVDFFMKLKNKCKSS